MEQKVRRLPNKQIRPFLIQLFLYMGVALGATLLVGKNSPVTDWLLVFFLYGICLVYAYRGGMRIFRTSYTINGNTATIKKWGKTRILQGEDVLYAYYDSNSRNMELHIRDGSTIRLVEYDDLRPMVDFLDDRGIRMDYKRITQK
ncbi:hypothetical protein LJC20_01230 [Eubacteriales bacterium OttesenSCG-928-M02]|nr:hypothetical protein [Eubacteriales bacterium OttesenSCG-928-M02]